MNFDANRSTAARIFFLVRAALSILHCTPGTSFQNEAWQGFAPNPTRQNGQVNRREQAARMGKPSAMRAVANAEDESLRK